MQKVFTKKIFKLKSKIDNIESKVKKLEELAHPAADFICTECGTKAKRIK